MKKSCIKSIAITLLLSVLGTWIGIIPITAQEVLINKFHCTATLEDEFTDNEIIIMVMPEYNFESYTEENFGEIGCIEVEELTLNVEVGIINRIILLTLDEKSKQNVLDSIALLELRDDIYSAEPNYIDSVCAIPDDTYYDSTPPWSSTKISLPAAWDITTGSSTIYVGVIDTGIQADHEDLQNRVNTELSRCFSPDYNTALEDEDGHGTLVAGIIGAEGDNGVGIAGVCWNVQLVSLRVANDSGTFNWGAVIQAIEYADSVGIQILNYSGGVDEYSNSVEYQKNAIQQYSGLVVCSAGNDNQDNDSIPHYPSEHNNLSNVISVGASNRDDKRWYEKPGKDGGSNYGKNRVDLFAPGQSIPTTAINDVDGYEIYKGTSAAAPFVTGVAALMLSTHPDLTATQIKNIIMSSVDKVDALTDLCVSGGRLNAYKALTHKSIHTICSYENNGVSVGHTVTCLSCDVTYSESHTWITAGLKYRCGKCGVLSSAIPVLPFALSPEICNRIEQMNYFGDFAMDIGDGTVLCRVGDDYYLVRGRTEDTVLSYLQNELSVVTPDLDAA